MVDIPLIDNGGTGEAKTTFTSDETADIEEDNSVDLINDVGSVTRTREGDPLAGTRGPLDKFINFATRNDDELPASVQAPASVDPGNDVDTSEPFTVTRIDLSDEGGTAKNETATAALQTIPDTAASAGDAAASTAKSLKNVGENLDLIIWGVLALGVIVALGQLVDWNVGDG